MADGTRARQMDIGMEKISAQIANLQQQLREEIKSLVLPLQVQLYKLSENFEARKAIGRDQDDASQFSGRASNQIAISAASRSFRVKFPRFGGEDPTDWLFKVDRFFSYHCTPENQKLTIVAFHMDGPAAQWFQSMHHSNQLKSWIEFETALKFHFGQSAYDDPQGALTKLIQIKTVSEYQTQFEELSSKVFGLSEQFFKSYFISGLKPEIRRKVVAHQPITLHHAIGLARLQEDRINETKLGGRTWIPKPEISNSILGTKPITTILPPATTVPPNRLPIKKLTTTEIQQKREKGLCFNCDEKFHIGHKCKNQTSLLLLEGEENEEQINSTISDEIEAEEEEFGPAISLHALTSQASPKTLRLQGVIVHHQVQTLVDSDMDYSKLTMDFMWQGTKVHLQGVHTTSIASVNLNQLKRMKGTKSIDSYYTLSSYSIHASVSQFEDVEQPNLNPKIEELIQQFQKVKSILTSLRSPPNLVARNGTEPQIWI
ncbi:hypothetical protein NE237_031192 [Protea cynaroides]|uniref:Ty3 transposon capsid-like protein domain-containing protein n=1 Tax=Protea cynaroides TaxID=273540 RepID=A0A9Q0R2C5_9MAGN|nr:hypothetical protein NE237_031192 [Protea cynaroides]